MPQKLLLDYLGEDWKSEYIVITPWIIGFPTCFKIDLACPARKIAIECDGSSHNGLKAKERDKRKDDFLRSVGWTVLRLWNKDILNWSNSGMPTGNYISMTFKQLDIPPSASAVF